MTRWFHIAILILAIILMAGCQSHNSSSAPESRVAKLESAVDSLRKENKELRSEIHLRDSINEQAILDFEERIVYLENFVSDTEWGVYEGRK